MKKSQEKVQKESIMKRVGKRKGLVAIGIIAVLLIALVVVKLVQDSGFLTGSEEAYSVHVLRKEDPILFDGIVEAKEIQEEYYDASKGSLAEVLVENGQSVEKGADLFTYTNEESQTLLDEQNRQYSRLKEKRSDSLTNLANARQALKTANANIRKSKQTIQASSKESLNSLAINTKLEAAQNSLMAYEADKAQAEAKIESAEMSISQMDEQLEDAEYEIKKVRKNISSTVKAKLDGIIEIKETNTNAILKNEQAILRLASHDLTIETSASEYDYNKIDIDKAVEIHPLTSDKVIKGKISQVSRLPAQLGEGSSSSSYPFTVIPEEKIQYGFSVQVGIKEDLVYIPQAAVIEDDKKMIALVNKEGIVERREIKVSKEGKLYILQDGIEVGEEVILNPDPELADGEEVTVIYD